MDGERVGGRGGGRAGDGRVEVAHDGGGVFVAELGEQVAAERERRELDDAARSTPTIRSRPMSLQSTEVALAAGDEEVPLAPSSGVAPLRSGTQRPMSSMPSWSMSAATGRSRTPMKPRQLKANRWRSARVVRSRRRTARSKENDAVEVGAQVVEAVAVEVAHDRIARSSRGSTDVVATMKSWSVSKHQVAAGEQADLVAVVGVAVEVAGHRGARPLKPGGLAR